MANAKRRSPKQSEKTAGNKQAAKNRDAAKKKNPRAEMEAAPKKEEEIKDIVEKEFLGFLDVAEDLLNVLLYDGKQVTKKEKLLAGPTETIYQGENRLRSQLEDLCMYEMESGKVGLMYLIANQSSIDDKMLLRKAGYTGGAYRGQYEGKMLDTFPVIEIVLYWGEEKWESDSTFREFFEERRIPEKKWKYIDEMKLHVFQMRYLPEETRKQFQSDMRIIVDFLAEGDSYCSDRKVKHKAALIKMIKTLSGERVQEGEVEKWLEEQGIREEDEVKMCELFEQYERKGKAEGEKLGIIKGKIDDILDFLRECGEIPRALQEMISKEQSIEVLKRWLKIAAKVKSIEEFQSAM